MALTADQRKVLALLLAEDRAKSFQASAPPTGTTFTIEQKALLDDGEIQRYWPELDPDYFGAAVEFLRTYTYVETPDYLYIVTKDSVLGPMVEGNTVAGLWRNAFVSVKPDADGTPRVVQTLRLGFADSLEDDEARLVLDKKYADLEELLHVRWVNLDPFEARVLREGLAARDFSVDTLTIEGDVYGSGYEVAITELSWADDGSAVMDLILINTGGADLEFTVGLSCARTMTLWYAYNQSKDDLTTWMEGKGLHEKETGKEKDYRVLRRNSERGTYDVVASETVYEERSLEEHVSRVSYGETTWARSSNDSDEVATISQEDGKITSVRARKNTRCLIDQDLTIVEPNDRPRTTGGHTMMQVDDGIEHSEDPSDFPGADAAEVNVRVNWFWRRTDAGNYAWLLNTTTYEELEVTGLENSQAFETTITGGRRTETMPEDPVSPFVGTVNRFRKERDELGGWNHTLSTTVSSEMDSGWVEVQVLPSGTMHVRILRNVGKAGLVTILGQADATDVVTATPRYNDDGTIDAILTTRAASPMDTGWIEVASPKGLIRIRVLRNITLDALKDILDEALQGETVSTTPRYNNDGTLDAVVVRRPDWRDPGSGSPNLPHYDFKFPNIVYEEYQISVIFTRQIYKAERFVENAGVGPLDADGNVKTTDGGAHKPVGFSGPDGGTRSHHTGIVALGGGLYKSTVVWGKDPVK